MKKIAVVTSTRAEYGLLSPIVKELRKNENDKLKIELIVTGTHLYSEYGNTIEEIDDRIDHRITISIASNSPIDISRNQADALVKFTQLFSDEKFDAVVLLGDRYEILSVAIAAGNLRIPVFHLYGGDTTEGACDEWIRHSITKISYLHFVSNEKSKKRVIQLGEDPIRVFNYGSTSVENIIHHADMSKKDALQSVGLSDCDYAICTYHPVTMEDDVIDNMLENLFSAIGKFTFLHFIITKSNADLGGARINYLLDEFSKNYINVHVFSSLGVRRYLSLMKYSKFVLGNSSSGIIEAPCLHIPTVNIGDRQRGRTLSESIVNCGDSSKDIENAINKVLSKEFTNICKKVISPYGDGCTSKKISEKLIEVLNSGAIDIKKKFYDVGHVVKSTQ